jgi:hypothetical protein
MSQRLGARIDFEDITPWTEQRTVTWGHPYLESGVAWRPENASLHSAFFHPFLSPNVADKPEKHSTNLANI